MLGAFCSVLSGGAAVAPKLVRVHCNASLILGCMGERGLAGLCTTVAAPLCLGFGSDRVVLLPVCDSPGAPGCRFLCHVHFVEVL